MPTTQCLLIALGLGLAAAALSPVPHQTSEESLRGALDAVTRKQRSLAAGPYYAELPLKYQPGLQQVANDEIDDADDLAFIPSGKRSGESSGWRAGAGPGDSWAGGGTPLGAGRGGEVRFYSIFQGWLWNAYIVMWLFRLDNLGSSYFYAIRRMCVALYTTLLYKIAEDLRYSSGLLYES